MTIREALGAASPHVSLKAAWKRLIQASRRLRKSGQSVTIGGRSDVDRLLNLAAPEEWNPSALKGLLKTLVDSKHDGVEDEIARAIDAHVSLLLKPTQTGQVTITVGGGPDWLVHTEIDRWLGTTRGSLQCSATQAAAWVHHLDDLSIGGGTLSVRTDCTLDLPPVQRKDRDRRRSREPNLWLPNWDDVGRISLTPRAIADEHAACLRRYAEVMFDPFCGLGGDAIAAAEAGTRVFAAEVNPARLSHARLNADAMGVTERIRFYAESGPERLADWAREAPEHTLFLDPPWGGREWNREGMNWETLCGGYPALIPALNRAIATVIKLPRTFETDSLPADGGTWTLTLGLGGHSDHPADRVRFLCGLYRPFGAFKS